MAKTNSTIQVNMKSIVRIPTVFALAGILLAGAGCSSPKAVKSSESALSSMQALADHLEKGRAQVAKVMTSLNNVVASAADPKKAYKDFSSEASSLDKIAAATRDRAEKMKVSVKEHYALWDQELSAISNAELKQQSMERKAEVTKAFDDIKDSFNQVSLSFKPYLKDLQDLDRYLATDLSANGIAGANNMIAGLKTESVGVQRDIQNAATKIRELQASMGKVQK